MSVIVQRVKKWKRERASKHTFPTSHLETWQQRQKRKAALMVIYIKTLIYFSVVAMVMPPTWPYLQSIDPYASKTLVGWIIIGVPAFRPINALLVGYILKHFSIRTVTIVSGLFVMLSCAMWSTAYHAPVYGGYWLLFSRFVIGFFGAEFQIGTTHIGAATTKEERSTSMTILAGCLSMAYMLAPGVMSALSYIGPEGTTICGYVLNMYTVAGLLGLAAYSLVLALFLVYYEENDIAIREARLEETLTRSAETPVEDDPVEDVIPQPKASRTDYMAIVVCNLMGAHCYGWLQLPDTMMTPMLMDLYAWDEQKAVRRAGNLLTIYGLCALVGFVSTGRLAKKYPERGIMLAGNVIYLLGALVMFPLGTSMAPLAGSGGGLATVVQNNVTAIGGNYSRSAMSSMMSLREIYPSHGGHAYTMSLARLQRDLQHPLEVGLNQSSIASTAPSSSLGCPSVQTWCSTEPRPELAQLAVSFGLSMIATPFVLPMVNSAVSKILPPGNQSFMWGVVNGSANLGRLVYPLMNVYLYTYYGPRVQYAVMILLCVIVVILQLATFRRLKPKDPSASSHEMSLKSATKSAVRYGATEESTK